MKKISFLILSLLTLSGFAVDFQTGFEDNSTKFWVPFKSGEKVEIKEIQLSMRIDDYHVSFKLKNAQKILQEGDKVKVSLRMRGREQAYSQNAVETVKKFVADLADYGFIEKDPAIMGRNVSVVINPKKAK